MSRGQYLCGGPHGKPTLIFLPQPRWVLDPVGRGPRPGITAVLTCEARDPEQATASRIWFSGFRV